MKNAEVCIMDNTATLNSPDISTRQSKEELLQLVSFNLGGEEYGIEILKVQEINRMLSITKVPKSPEFVEGVINLRGKVIPIINLRKKFGLEEKKHDKQTRIVVVDIEGKILGLVVDSVSEVLRLLSSTIELPPSILFKDKAEYIKGIGKLAGRLLMLLDLDMILSNEEKAELNKVAGSAGK
jgi:purine-binding chemotaxis protein CheW